MKPSRITALWAEEKPVLNGWLSIANAFSAEIMPEQGYDSIAGHEGTGIFHMPTSVEFCTVYMVGMSTASCAVFDGAKRIEDIILDRGTLDMGSMKWVLANCSGPVPKPQCNTRIEGLVQDAHGRLFLTNVTVPP